MQPRTPGIRIFAVNGMAMKLYPGLSVIPTDCGKRADQQMPVPGHFLATTACGQSSLIRTHRSPSVCISCHAKACPVGAAHCGNGRPVRFPAVGDAAHTEPITIKKAPVECRGFSLIFQSPSIDACSSRTCKL